MNEHFYTEQDEKIKKQITMFAQEFTHQEDMALAMNAIQEIDLGNQLCLITPKNQPYKSSLNAAIGLLRHLSPRAKAEVAMTILWEAYMKPAVNDAPLSNI